MKLSRQCKLVMIGDSITDCGRAQPIGENHAGALGNGYVALVDSLLGAACPELGIRVVNVGLSGNTVRDLKQRWKRDVLALKPDWLSIMIGINDVWRQFDLPRQKEIHVGPEEYELTLEELCAETRPQLQGLVLMTPYFIEPRREDPMRVQMDRLPIGPRVANAPGLVGRASSPALASAGEDARPPGSLALRGPIMQNPKSQIPNFKEVPKGQTPKDRKRAFRVFRCFRRFPFPWDLGFGIWCFLCTPWPWPGTASTQPRPATRLLPAPSWAPWGSSGRGWMVGGGWWVVDGGSWFVPPTTLHAPRFTLHAPRAARSSFIIHNSSFILNPAPTFWRGGRLFRRH